MSFQKYHVVTGWQNLARLLLTVFTMLGEHGLGATRVANTTLAFPQEPYSYTRQNAFPGMNFDGVVAFATPPGETNRLFIVEKGGTILVITNLASPTKSVFLNISSRVDANGEGGLLGMAFHPGYATNRLFFVYYTLQSSTPLGTGLHDRLARFQTQAGNPSRADVASEVVLINQHDRADNHNGGDLHFGPDGYLYLSLGDEGGGGDSYGNSGFINRNFFAGILRLDVDKRFGSLAPNSHPASSTNYAVPADNPFVGATSFNGVAIDPATVRTEFWAVGLRNPWRFSFDDETGRLICGDVGEGAREEINIIERGGHYGWNYLEGTTTGTGTPPGGMRFIPPILQYPHGSGNFQGNSITGGRVYRGRNLPGLVGDYIFGDHAVGNIWAVRLDGTNALNWRRLVNDVGVACFGVDPSNGDLLYGFPWDFSEVKRLVATTPNGTLPAQLSGTGAFQNLATLTPQPGVVDYDLNAPFWSDHAKKRRWFSVPRLNQFIGFNSNANWSFPTGTVWVKHFEMEMTNGVASSSRRLETRFLVKNQSGVYGVTYKWNTAQTDATLVDDDGLDETLIIRDGATMRTQVWHYPGRSECATCHTPVGGHALGFQTHQLNRLRDDGGTMVNQILWLSQAGYFSAPVNSTNSLLAYTHPTNSAATLDHRVRSYLGANCSYCHRPGGTGRGHWDARLETPWAQAGIINGVLINDLGNPARRVVRPGVLAESMIHTRVSQLGSLHMPPLATSQLDAAGIGLLDDWIVNGVQGAVITGVEPVVGGLMQISFTGAPGRRYRVEASDTLSGWATLGTVTVGLDGTGLFVDPTPVVAGALLRTYRLAWP